MAANRLLSLSLHFSRQPEHLNFCFSVQASATNRAKWLVWSHVCTQHTCIHTCTHACTHTGMHARTHTIYGMVLWVLFPRSCSHNRRKWQCKKQERGRHFTNTVQQHPVTLSHNHIHTHVHTHTERGRHNCTNISLPPFTIRGPHWIEVSVIPLQ